MRLFRSPLVLSRSFAISDRYDSLRRPIVSNKRADGITTKEKKGTTSPRPSKLPEDPILPPPPREEPFTMWQQPPDAQVVRVAIVGLANAGKSTLLNALIGQSLAAVSSKPHTTRRGILGAYTRGSTQAVFVDTPGLVVQEEAGRRERELVRAPWDALEECDVALLLVDAAAPDEWRLAELAERMRPFAGRIVSVLNKIDAVQEGSELLRALDRVRALGLGEEQLLVSALKGTHVGELRDELLARAKPGDWEV